MRQISSTTIQQLFDDSVVAIESAYDRLGLELGWRFLYTPVASLACPSGIMLAGINPGGETGGIKASVEDGNAYLRETWSPHGTALQRQVRELFSVFRQAGLGNSDSGDALLNDTLTSNFCPFRSPTWAKLANEQAAVDFSRSLWDRVFSVVLPRYIVCLGRKPYEHFTDLLTNRANRAHPEQVLSTGWGKCRFRITAFVQPEGRTLLAYVPHLSQFKLMSSDACLPFAHDFAKALLQPRT